MAMNVSLMAYCTFVITSMPPSRTERTVAVRLSAAATAAGVAAVSWGATAG
jgi:hypothetical protein